MMRKYLVGLAITLLLSLISFGMVQAEGQDVANQPEIKLTDQQKTELAKIHKDILQKKMEMINKYVEYGMISKEKGNEIISRLKKHYQILERNGFSLQFDRFQKGHQHEQHQHE